MGNVIAAIHQPNFFPWLGYFLKISRSDIFIFLDDVQIPNSSSYVNRTKLNINNKARWFTVPVKRLNSKQLINQSYYSNNIWKKKIISTIDINYKAANFYNNHNEIIKKIILNSSNSIMKTNIQIIKHICDLLNINTKFDYSSSFNINTSSTSRLIEILKSVDADIYLSGLGSINYQNLNLFKSNQIKVIYNQFNHPKYQQLNTKSFISGLSILDLIFNIGIDKTKLIINKNNLNNN